MNSEIFENIKLFTTNLMGINSDKIFQDAGLERDLGIYGDDAVDYIIAFGKEFKVDVSKFMAKDYFSPEGDFILPSIIRLFTGKKPSKQKELLMRHLENSVIAGRLDEEIINQ